MMNPPWITTKSGVPMRVHSLDAKDFNLDDIAHGLSQICRFTGQSKRFYSVAQHSCLVADLVYNNTKDVELAKSALLHDATEAYLGDIPGPFKKLCPGYEMLERSFGEKIQDRFKLKYEFSHPEIKKADVALLLAEMEILFDHPIDIGISREDFPCSYKIFPVDAKSAYRSFLIECSRWLII